MGTTEKTMEDRQIIDLFWQRDEQAIKETEKKYGKMMLRIATGILHDAPDSEECRNDAYLDVWNAIPPNRPANLAAFVTVITRNSAINRYKEKKKKGRVPSEMTDSIAELESSLSDGNTPESEVTAKELGRLINEYITTLPPRRREIFVGRFYLSNTLETIAQELGTNVTAVYREIKKIKKSLKAYLERNGEYL